MVELFTKPKKSETSGFEATKDYLKAFDIGKIERYQDENNKKNEGHE
jgi:hypothetical protein